MRLVMAALFGAMSLAACAHPGDRVPPGYAEACWGGRDNDPRYIAFTDRRLIVSVVAEDRDWALLANIVLDVAVRHGFETFDTSVGGDHLSALKIEACHPSGVSLRLDKRIWANPRTFDQRVGETKIVLYTYRLDAPFEQFSDALVKKVQATWKDARVERFPAVPPAKKALPDAVRRLLVQECAAAQPTRPDYCEGL
jgi:hypothetical protein